MASSNSSEGLLDVAEDGFEAGGFSGEDRLPERDSMLSGAGEALSHGAEGSGGIDLGEGPPVPLQREGDQERVAVGAGGGHGLLGDGLASSARPDGRQEREQPAQADDAWEPGLGARAV